MLKVVKTITDSVTSFMALSEYRTHTLLAMVHTRDKVHLNISISRDHLRTD